MNPFGIKTLKSKDFGIPEELISIYKKQKNYRTLKDNLLLMQNNVHLSCFQKILKSKKEGELIYETIIKNLDFAIYDRGKVIYHPKDIITNLFYIFSGSVKVDKTQFDSFGSPFKYRSLRLKSNNNINNNKIKNSFNSPIKEYFLEESVKKEDNFYINNSMKLNNNKKDVKELGFYKKLFGAIMKYKKIKRSEIIIEDKRKKSNEIIILEKGDEYGQDDLNLPKRLDLVVAQTPCIIGFLSKHDWKYIFEKIDILKKNDILSFLKTLKILREVNNEVIFNNIFNAIKERNIYRGEYLIKRGEKVNKFYIIRKGDFQVNLNIKQKVKNQFNDLNYFGNYTFIEKSKNLKYESKNYYFNEEKYKIVTFGEGEIIGDIEIFLGSKKYLSNIFCNTDSSLVYEISYKDLNANSNKTMYELLLKEGQQKLKYFRNRIKDIKNINSKKMQTINRFKEIISRKLEEEKGEVFNQMENNKNGKLKYEKRRRKRLKSATLNNKLKNIIRDINEQKFENNIFINYKFQTGKGRNNITFKLDKENKNEFPIFPTSVKNSYLTNDIDKVNNNKYDILKKRFSKYISSSISNKNNKNAISFLFSSSKKRGYLCSKDSSHFNHVFSQNIKIIKNLQNLKVNTNIFNLKSEKVVRNNKILLSKKKLITLNDKFQNIFTRLFINKKNRNHSIEDYDSINNMNYYNTQDSSIKKTNDFSKISLNYEKNDNIKVFWSPKMKENFANKERVPLLTEIINDRKNSIFRKLSSSKNKKINYIVKKDN